MLHVQRFEGRVLNSRSRRMALKGWDIQSQCPMAQQVGCAWKEPVLFQIDFLRLSLLGDMVGSEF